MCVCVGGGGWHGNACVGMLAAPWVACLLRCSATTVGQCASVLLQCYMLQSGPAGMCVSGGTSGLRCPKSAAVLFAACGFMPWLCAVYCCVHGWCWGGGCIGSVGRGCMVSPAPCVSSGRGQLCWSYWLALLGWPSGRSLTGRLVIGTTRVSDPVMISRAECACIRGAACLCCTCM